MLARSCPTLPFDPSGAYVWQLPQPWLLKTGWPAAASPFTTCGFGIVPSTVFGRGETVFAPPQAASSTMQPARSGTRRRIGPRVYSTVADARIVTGHGPDGAAGVHPEVERDGPAPRRDEAKEPVAALRDAPGAWLPVRRIPDVNRVR